jgi:hypothetical protein
MTDGDRADQPTRTGRPDPADETDRPAPPDPDARAVAAPATAAAVRRSTLIAAALLIVGVLCAAGGLLLRWELNQSATALEREGVRTPGTITAVDSLPVGPSRQMTGSVTVSFQANGAAQTVQLNMGSDVVQYQPNQQVTVMYDAANPSVAGIVGQSLSPTATVPWVLTLGFGLVLVLAGVVMALLLRRTRRIVRSQPWIEVPAEVQEVLGTNGLQRQSTIVLVLRDPTRGRNVIAETVGLRRFGVDLEPVAWAAGWDDKRFVVSPSGGGRLIPVRHVKRAATSTAVPKMSET